MAVAAASCNPKKAFRLMKEIERLKCEVLVEEHGMDVLWQRLPSELQNILKGHLLKELFLEDESLAIQNPPSVVNGR